jgi:hypothetical protein
MATTTPAVTPVGVTPAVRTTASAGAYRPGGTSSYSPSAQAGSIEVASRPAPPTSTLPTSTPLATPGTGSDPWTPPAPSASPTGSRY